jgi:hypothetical protein
MNQPGRGSPCPAIPAICYFAGAADGVLLGALADAVLLADEVEPLLPLEGAGLECLWA